MNDTKQHNRVVETGPDHRDGEMYFSPHDLVRFELAQERVVNVDQAIELRRREASEAQRQHDARMQSIAVEVAKLRALKSKREDALRDLRAELAKVYDLDLARITYDDETGLIRILPEGN